MGPEHICYIAGAPVRAPGSIDVLDKFRGTVAARVGCADAGMIDAAFAGAHAARARCAAMPAFERSAALRAISRGLEARRADFEQALVAEVGKPIRDARVELDRAIATFALGAEEAGRITGEYLPLDHAPRSAGVEAISARFPVGVVSLITPFNFPVNMAAHKIAPAMAAGCPCVLKPSEKTPLTSMMLGEIIAESGWPADAWSIVATTVENAERFVTDDRIALVSFTGSVPVGWAIRAKASRKKVVLELGGDAACIVDEGADLDRVVARAMIGIYSTSGQSCISVQRILAHRSVLSALRSRLVEATRGLRVGDPSDEATQVGPLIAQREAERLESWIAEAKAAGAAVLCGGERTGAILHPTLMEGVPDHVALGCKEAFGPIAVLEGFDRFEDALARVNRSSFGLQTGVFTPSIDRAFLAFRTLEVGAVVINDVPTFRTDAMPYGGVKDSGMGREGVRSAILECTEQRLMILSTVGRLPHP
jgi:acyl-CoA reductase-like NAD-dependent aldehyde dehydrogenase